MGITIEAITRNITLNSQLKYWKGQKIDLEDDTISNIRLLKWFKDIRNHRSRAGLGMLSNNFKCVLKMKISNHRGWIRSLSIRAVAPPYLTNQQLKHKDKIRIYFGKRLYFIMTNIKMEREQYLQPWYKFLSNLFSLLPSTTTLLFWAFHRVSTLSLTEAKLGSSGYEKQ